MSVGGEALGERTVPAAKVALWQQQADSRHDYRSLERPLAEEEFPAFKNSARTAER
jgi:hypothetical protein